jgi:hypothetical protein
MKLVLMIDQVFEGAVVDHYDDGQFQTFHKVEAHVAEGDRAGKKLTILVEAGDPLFDQWNRPAQKLSVSISPEDLRSPQLFAAAFTVVQP